MSDTELKSEISHIINSSGYKETSNILCPIIRIVAMRHTEVPLKQISNVAKSLL